MVKESYYSNMPLPCSLLSTIISVKEKEGKTIGKRETLLSKTRAIKEKEGTFSLLSSISVKEKERKRKSSLSKTCTRLLFELCLWVCVETSVF